MLWQIIVGLAAVFLPPASDRLDASQEISEISTPYGPQSPRELAQAREALHGDHQNGDMLFSDDFPSEAGIRDTKYRWPGYPGSGVVPYVIDSALASLKPKIQQAMNQYHQLTCIKFVPRTNQRDYIYLMKGRGCYSWVGKQGKGKQDVSLGAGCEYVGTIVHELGHAVGLYHEHQRSDRDTYLTVNENNVIAGKGHNFNKTLASQELIFTGYDYSSIMHYGNYAFSKQPGKLPTMVAKNGVQLLEPYNKPGFTNTDIDQVKKLYKC